MWRKSLLLLLLELVSYSWSRLRAQQSLKPSRDSNASRTEPKALPPNDPRETVRKADGSREDSDL
jgi:hypothetical protein